MSAQRPESQHRRPSKPLHDMDEDERLAALQEWAEGKKYVFPGENGTFAASGPRGVSGLAFGGPLATVVSENQRAKDKYAGQYDAPVGPPAYHVATNQAQVESRNPFKRWAEKRKAEKEVKRSTSAPAYTP